MAGSVFASMIPAIIGVNDYMTPLDAWELITRRRDAEPQSIHARAGELLEPLGIEIAEQLGIRVLARQKRYERSLGCVTLIARSDAVVETDNGPALLSIKTSRNCDYRASYGVQLVAEACAAGLAMPGIVLVISRADLSHAIYDVPITQEQIDEMASYIVQWWQSYVEADVPPPATSYDTALRRIAYDDAIGDAYEMTLDDALELRDITERIKTAAETLEQLKRQRDEIMRRYLEDHPARVYTCRGRKIATVIQPKERITYDVDVLLSHVPESVRESAKRVTQPKPYVRYV